MSRFIGYARVAEQGDREHREVVSLHHAGAETVFVDTAHASNEKLRPNLVECLAQLDAGDVLMVSSVVDVARSVDEFVRLAGDLRRRGIMLRSLTEPALSTDAGPAEPSDVLTALDDVRHRLLAERTREGIAAARAKGRAVGRPRVMTDERIQVAHELRAQDRTYAQIARAIGVSEAAVRRALTPSQGQKTSA